MTSEEQHELLIRLDERTASMDTKLDDHIESCENDYAKKSDVDYIKKGFWGIISFVFVFVGGFVLKVIFPNHK